MSYALHAQNILSAINELKANRTADTTKMMADELALIKARVINSGTDAQGGQFKKYSKSVVKSPFYIPKLTRMGFTNPVKKIKEIQKKHGYHFSYETFRQETGRPIDHRNFSLSGKMWKAVEVIITAVDEFSTTYIFGAKDPEMQKLIDYNKAEDGDFLATSNDELELLRKLNQQRVLRVLQNHNVI